MNKDIGLLSKQGNEARTKKLSPQERSNIAKNAAKARWEAYRLRKDHSCIPTCNCENCNRMNMKHADKNSKICKKFICERI